jgi:hypothetical protein
MITNFEDFRRVLGLIFQDGPRPNPLHLVEPLALARAGTISIAELAKNARTTPARLRGLAERPDPLSVLLGAELAAPSERTEARVRNILGQLVIGNLAEKVFEDLYRTTVRTSELELKDDRQGRGDTDYLVFNGQGRQVFRINIKFHGSLFRRAKDLVGLDPEDCFALATYKIHAALVKQDTEHLPYIFVIVGVPGLTGTVVGAAIPEDLVHLCAICSESSKLSGKRQVEDQIVEKLTTDPSIFHFEDIVDHYTGRIREAQWFVLSARRANLLLRDMLFDRAYALRVRSFARNYAGAELDMHFSLSQDLRPLTEFLQILRDHGMPGLVSRLERGTL